ncbi:hypothetical protein [Asticcacaulis benevestitus]|uniref:DUF2157 domain-containing protein n=1 Tax=Asticcacaulis benevestitus DSM 16100 = ATCC BAA-896 TaxID=1121022 RepID=V4Q015_9CAUL|nr:hypothetical protein [Asticcacaulis benevestitus]ESQ91145.1 hypothetical protein ABENE_10835 [Asticcacaulis benevestitus DSM 16100 = ATCC BAA-896]
MADERITPIHDGILPRLDMAEVGYLGDELRQLRELVSRGDTLAISGGSVMAWWGLVLSLAHVLKALISAHFLPHDLPVNLATFILGYGGALVIVRRGKQRHIFRSWRTQAMSTLWTFAGIGIFVFLVGSEWAHVAEPHITMAFVAIVFSLVLAVMATSSRQPWLLFVAAGWILTACAMFVLNGEVQRYVLMASAALLFMVVPGFLLMRAEKRAQPKEFRL